MSTILKALKRVDQSTPPPDDLQSGPSMLDTRKAIRGRLFRIWLQRKAVAALIIAVVVIAAGSLIYSQKDRLISKIGTHSPSKKPPVFQAKIEPPPRQPERTEPQQTAPLNRQQPPGSANAGRDREGAERPSAPSSRSPSGQQNSTRQMTTLKPQVRAPESRSSAPSSGSSSPETKPGGSGQREIRPPQTAPAEKSKSRAVPTARSYPRLDKAELKLQAIAWSNVAAERIAVINDRIVREGESVEGYSINQIRQDDVVVNDGAQSWQLEFELR
ncbi:MAG: hypothetical protein JRE88_08345 [Deltaproteobacteria bacterium]|nr:hypothetical protein [Deltaproteobacteria bacterium]